MMPAVAPPEPQPIFYRFGLFELDVRTCELRKRGQRIKLQDQPLQVLTALLERAGDVVSREELRNRLWTQNTFVDFDTALNKAINKIREALDDSAETPRFVETLPRRGYRFIAPVERSAEAAVEVSASSPAQTRAAAMQAGTGRWARTLAGVALAIVAATGIFAAFRRQPKLVSNDTIVVADFENKTGDPVFDDTLKQALAAGLQQSPFFRIISEEALGKTLRLMTQHPHDPLTLETARDLCQRVGSKAVLTGTIASLGRHYAIGLNAVSCVSGDWLDREEVEAAGKEEVLSALDKATTQMRRKLGESLSSIQRFQVPIAFVTTPSLDALKAWSAATITRLEKGDAASIPLFKRAISLDPDFAIAHAQLATVYANLQEPSLAAASMKEAYELRQRSSEWERFYIESRYYHFATGQLEKAAEVYEVCARTYLWDSASLANLGASYESLGQYEKAIAAAQEAIRRDDNEFANSNIVAMYAAVNRLDDAWSTHRRAQERQAETPAVHAVLYSIASLQENAAEMSQEETSIEKIGGLEDRLRSMQADDYAFHGRIRQAREYGRRAVEAAKNIRKQEAAALWQMQDALREAQFGNSARARQIADAALRLAPTRDVQALGALVFAQAGDFHRAQRLAEGLARQFPLHTLINAYWLPAIRAAIQVSNNNPAKALEILQDSPYELGIVPFTAEWAAPLHPVYVRGQAYLMLHRGKEAATEYQKFLDHRGLVRNCTPGAALAYLGLARAYALQGDTEKARAAYKDFLTLWKDADPDIPVLRQAKVEYAKLR